MVASIDRLASRSCDRQAGHAPVTVCRNNGRNDVAANITAPSRKLIAKHRAATELPHSLSGRIGSGRDG